MYTNVPKPTGANYTNVANNPTDLNPYGGAIYGVAKYGISNNYSNVAKPTGSSYTVIAKPT